MYYYCLEIVKSIYFSRFISFLIICNTIDLSLDRYPESEEESRIYDLINTVFSFIFVGEMFLKLLAFGFKNYF